MILGMDKKQASTENHLAIEIQRERELLAFDDFVGEPYRNDCRPTLRLVGDCFLGQIAGPSG